MRNKNHTSPPSTNTPHGDASERTHMDWILHSQNDLKGDVGELKSDFKHVCEALKRMEDQQVKLLEKIEKNEGKLDKINTRLLIFTAVFATAITVGGFFINGQASKTFEFMQNLTKAEQTTKVE